jgi:hypothetical protein
VLDLTRVWFIITNIETGIRPKKTEKKMSNLETANTIREQIKQGQGVTGQQGALCLMAWGAQTFVGGEESVNNRGFLQFKVSGMKFKGLVKIKLEWNDTYTVEFWKGRGTKIRMVDSSSEVYFFELTPTIDLYVEGE